MKQFVAYVDGLGVFTDYREDLRTKSDDPQRRMAKVRRRWRDAGLDNVKMYWSPFGRGLFSSLAPLWPVAYSVEERAEGVQPHDLKAVLEALYDGVSLQRRRGGYYLSCRRLARVTRIDLAVEVHGVNAEIALRTLLPSIRDLSRDESIDLIRVKGWNRRKKGSGRIAGSWVHHAGYETIYGQRRRTSGRNVVVYCDRRSSLPEAPPTPVMKFEVRLGPRYLQEVRDQPMALLPYMNERNIWEIVAQHIEFPGCGTSFASRARSGYLAQGTL